MLVFMGIVYDGVCVVFAKQMVQKEQPEKHSVIYQSITEKLII